MKIKLPLKIEKAILQFNDSCRKHQEGKVSYDHWDQAYTKLEEAIREALDKATQTGYISP